MPETGHARFLRRPQLRALETYWYLRLIERTPHVFDLYQKLYPPEENISQLLEALGVPDTAFKATNFKAEVLWRRIKTDDVFVRDFDLESLRETLTLDYPSYILALAMGAGKTILIGAIFATEFAMALEYPDGSFVQNALVFAPGKTILESLRELMEVPYEKILPPRFFKPFAASVKLTFTRDGEGGDEHREDPHSKRDHPKVGLGRAISTRAGRRGTFRGGESTVAGHRVAASPSSVL